MSCSRTQRNDAGETRPAALRSRGKHSITERLRSHIKELYVLSKAVSITELYECIHGEDLSKKLVRQATAEPDRNSQAMERFSYNRDDNNLLGILRQLQKCIEMLNRQRNTQARSDQIPRDRNSQRLCYIFFSASPAKKLYT